MLTFDKRTRRFRDQKTGRFVSRESLRNEMNKTRDVFRRDASRLADRLNTGKLTPTKWAKEMSQLVKENLILNASIGKGGRLQMTKADWGRAGANIKREYRYLNGFADAVKSGRLSPLQINARARLYADAGHVAFSQAMIKSQGEIYTEAKRSLHASESCSGCIPLAGVWKPIDEMPAIGSVSPCGPRCRCSLEFR